jgi:penicillin-insensitive murein endopeptidase
MPSERNRSSRRSLSAAACLLLAALPLAAPAIAQTKGQLGDITKPPMPEISNYVPAKVYFGRAVGPAPLRPEVFGSYSRGCIAGAKQVPADGPAWQVMRPSRDRAWGHPELIALIKRLAVEAKANDGWNGLLVGDLQQPRGGPMLTGHASHQLGLDADIWLTPMPDRTLSRKERETMSATLMTKDRKTIDASRWTEAHARLIKRAASYKEVERIFVHPPIKKALCDWAGNKGAWLAKVRPLYGHNYHFHIRMGCPKGSPKCKPQGAARPKDGTGCGDELAYWYSDKPWNKPKKTATAPSKKKTATGVPIPRPKPVPRQNLAWLPSECRALIAIK